MRIVVTGATGNVGSALLRRLTEHQVVGVVRRPPERSLPPFSGVEWVAADLAEEDSAAALRQAVEGADAVVHLAWGFQPSHRDDYLEALDLGGTQRVLDAVAAAGVPHLVHMSSVGAYSPKVDDVPVDESWPTDGVPTSRYSRHKARAERLLDDFEATGSATVVARMRPGIMGQREAGSSLLRYVVPAAVPSAALGLVPVVPLDRRLAIPMLHTDDAADAIVRVLERRAGGAFNLAGSRPVTAEDVAAVVEARHVHVPARALRGLAAGAWHARLQQVDPGWLDLAYAVPLLDCGRAERELDWRARVDPVQVLVDTVTGMRERAAAPTPVLRPRTVAGQLARLVRRGPVSERRRP